uniref:4-hydroxybenzoate polyprenyltransferase, mitochondrial n=1 Tax=Globodera rostochiensis TaxID=31243 RepID=A0A914GVD2_GLORO
MRADKPIGSWLLYWPCAWSIALGAPPGCLPSFYFLTLFGAGAFLMRSAGCVLNDLWDQNIDKQVDRTKFRPLASGEVSEKEAVFLLAGLLTTSLAVLLQLNWLSVILGSSSVFLVVVYPLAKRYTRWPQLVLGITFNWGALLGYTAVTGTFSSGLCIPLYLACVCWTVIYDTIYAHQDKKDDLLIGLGSTALEFGNRTDFWLAFVSMAMLTNLFFVGLTSEQFWPYFLTLFASASHLAWQLDTLRTDDPKDCWEKFRANQWLGAAIFIGIVLSNLLKSETREAPEGKLKEQLEAADEWESL